MTFHPLHPLHPLGIMHKMCFFHPQPSKHQWRLHFLTRSFVGECAGKGLPLVPFSVSQLYSNFQPNSLQ